MPAVLSYPGVYVEERPSGARAIAGVSTSICAFVGMAERGRMEVPKRITSIAAYERAFGATSSGEMADQVGQFFLNGGSDAYVCRIADNALTASVTLRNEAGTDTLRVDARDPGALGNLIGIEVDYDTDDPERTFGLSVYLSRPLPGGGRSREEAKRYPALSMDPASANFVQTRINGDSELIEVTALAAVAAPAGVSIAGLVLPAADAAAVTALTALVDGTHNAFQIRIGNHEPAPVTLSAPAATLALTATAWTNDVTTALAGAGVPDNCAVTFATDVAAGQILKIASTDGAVTLSAAAENDVSAGLMLGVAAGGIEGDSFGDLRPAPTNMVSRVGSFADDFLAFFNLAGAARAGITRFTLQDDSPEKQHVSGDVIDMVDPLQPTALLYQVGTVLSFANVRAALEAIGAAIGDNVSGRWRVARRHNRLVLAPTYDPQRENVGAGATLTTGAAAGAVDLGAAGQIFDPASATPAANVVAYTVGRPNDTAGTGPFQTAAVKGTGGAFPKLGHYKAAFRRIEQEVDIFNLMVLPRAEGQSDDDRAALWGAASALCASERAFLVIDPRADWLDIDTAEQGANAIRIGVETRNAACYFPRLRATDLSGAVKVIDPGGSVAGVMARTDARRGIWKAPAGLEATIRGVRGVERQMSDPDNGRLNPRALNAIRLFAEGVVIWGARTLVGFDSSGNIDNKYVSVQRTMLYIEESLYRGIKFAVFEPNDEPLWAQLRLAAGSFMHGLFRQGAFAGQKASDAYFVVCDDTTTTQADRNLGIVNIIVGFAPLKPAEFVVLTVTQMAGQDQL
jgi:phage tail sheath protein FI